jgi:LMBR1 domain-containing protein 1
MDILEWYILGAALVFFVIIVIGNIYFLAKYAHPKDTPFGSSIFMRIVVVLGYTIAYLPIIIVLLDVANTHSIVSTTVTTTTDGTTG